MAAEEDRITRGPEDGNEAFTSHPCASQLKALVLGLWGFALRFSNVIVFGQGGFGLFQIRDLRARGLTATCYPDAEFES